MTDRNKRLEKILKRHRIKAMYKPVDCIEKSHFVLIENKKCTDNSKLITTEEYKDILKRGETYPPENVHFLAIINKRKTQTIKYNIIGKYKKAYI